MGIIVMVRFTLPAASVLLQAASEPTTPPMGPTDPNAMLCPIGPWSAARHTISTTAVARKDYISDFLQFSSEPRQDRPRTISKCDDTNSTITQIAEIQCPYFRSCTPRNSRDENFVSWNSYCRAVFLLAQDPNCLGGGYFF